MRKPQRLVLGVLAALAFWSVAQEQSSNPSQSPAGPAFTITPVKSKVSFYVKSSVKVEGTFEKWDATLVFTSTDASTGVLDIKIQAASVHSDSQSKDELLKGENCFDAAKYPYITFHSTKIRQTGHSTFDVRGTFTLHGVSKPAGLTFTVDRDGEGANGDIKGVLTIDRKDYGLGGGIPFVRIADRVDVSIAFKAMRVGPPLVMKQ
jgi:polyisoprenoid-binding protein YceI